MKALNNNPKVVCKLLRAIASGTDAKASNHDIVFRAAADIIETLEANVETLQNEAMGEDL